MPLNNRVFVVSDDDDIEEIQRAIDYAGNRLIEFVGCQDAYVSGRNDTCEDTHWRCSSCAQDEEHCLVAEWNQVGRVFLGDGDELRFRGEHQSNSIAMNKYDMFKWFESKKDDHIKKVKEAHRGRDPVHKKHKKRNKRT